MEKINDLMKMQTVVMLWDGAEEQTPLTEISTRGEVLAELESMKKRKSVYRFDKIQHNLDGSITAEGNLVWPTDKYRFMVKSTRHEG